MNKKSDLFDELLEMKNSIQNNNFDINSVPDELSKIDTIINKNCLLNESIKNNIIKSFFTTFNVSNFSDLTILFISYPDSTKIIEYAGNIDLYNKLKEIIETDKDFFKNIDSIKIKDIKFRFYFESMKNNSGLYTIVTITESRFFMPSKFHMLSDIIMDLIRSSDMSTDSVFNDLFEDTAIQINNSISSDNKDLSELYLFKFENIYNFFLKMGLEIIIELSETIKKKLIESFGDNSTIFRFSLSEYIVISSKLISEDTKYSELNNGNLLDFNYKGIVLQHRCIKIPYTKTQSVYDIFQTIFSIDKG